MRAFGLGLGFVVLYLAAGCSAFSDHNKTTKESRNAFESGRFDQALKELEEGVGNHLDGLCFQLDRGVIAQVGGMLPTSISEFERAESTITKFEDRGLGPGSAAEFAGSFLVNEKTIPYQGEAFEKVLVPVFQSRNYLFQGESEGAMIEVRRIYEQQDIVRRLYEKELDETNKKAQEEKVDSSKIKVEGQVDYPQDALKSPESLREITIAHYISALVAERMDNVNDAYISMKDVAKVRGDLKFVQQDLLRFAREMGMDEDVQDYKKRFPDVALPGKDDGSVTLFFDCGWAPHKKELKFPLPSFNTIGAVAIPLYERTPNPATHARLVLNDKVFDTQVLSDVDAIAFKYHRDRLPLMVLKQIIRTTIKVAAGEAAAYGAREGSGNALVGLGAGLAVGVYNYASEQADLRAWLTLPQTFQAVRGWVPAGSYDVKVELCGPGGGVLRTVSMGQINVTAGSQRFVQARSLGNSLFAQLLAEKADAKRPRKDPPKKDPTKKDAPKHDGATVEPIGPREGGTPRKADKTAPPKERTESHLAPDAPKKSAAPPKEHVDAPLAPKKAPTNDDSDIPAAEPASEGKD